jgi:hypothetical protein
MPIDREALRRDISRAKRMPKEEVAESNSTGLRIIVEGEFISWNCPKVSVSDEIVQLLATLARNHGTHDRHN